MWGLWSGSFSSKSSKKKRELEPEPEDPEAALKLTGDLRPDNHAASDLSNLPNVPPRLPHVGHSYSNLAKEDEYKNGQSSAPHIHQNIPSHLPPSSSSSSFPSLKNIGSLSRPNVSYSKENLIPSERASFSKTIVDIAEKGTEKNLSPSSQPGKMGTKLEVLVTDSSSQKQMIRQKMNRTRPGYATFDLHKNLASPSYPEDASPTSEDQIPSSISFEEESAHSSPPSLSSRFRSHQQITLRLSKPAPSFEAPPQKITRISDSFPPNLESYDLKKPWITKVKRYPRLTVGALFLGGLLFFLFIYLFIHRTPEIVVTPNINEGGQTFLSLRCERCDDGTLVFMDKHEAIFFHHEATLLSDKPLSTGDNLLSLQLRNKKEDTSGKSLQIPVQVPFQIFVDYTNMDSPHPKIILRYEALGQIKVKIDGQNTPLLKSEESNTLVGKFEIPLDSSTFGQNEKSQTLEKHLPYSFESSEDPNPKMDSNSRSTKARGSGLLVLRVSIPPLKIDTPRSEMYTTQTSILVSGRTVPNMNVSVADTKVISDERGQFQASVPLPQAGDFNIHISTSQSGLAARHTELHVSRIENPDVWVAEKEKNIPDMRQSLLEKKTEIPLLLKGQVLESRLLGKQTVAILSYRNDCSNPPCIARVLTGENVTYSKGNKLIAYGTLSKYVEFDGALVPEILSDFSYSP